MVLGGGGRLGMGQKGEDEEGRTCEGCREVEGENRESVRTDTMATPMTLSLDSATSLI